MVVAAVWWWIGQGLVSSNDGSHLALARALVVHGQTRIDAEESLTLWTDRAYHEGHVYSDRPPGTAFAAAPAVWLGHRLDSVLRGASQRRGAILYMPATDRYVQTYGVRRQRHGGAGPPLVDLQGTAALLTAQAALVGALGVWAVVVLLRRHGVGAGGQLFAALTMSGATLWGPYSTALFSHVTAGTALVLGVLAIDRAHDRHVGGDPAARWIDALAGLALALAVATDYALVLAVVPGVALLAPPRRWPALVFGALPIAVATAAYHDAAFGSPWAIGYDYHARFAFARDAASTFSGDPLLGLWTLWGLGGGAGVLAQSPVLLLGIVGLAIGGQRRALLALLPWSIALALHRTPYGGATLDHRYMVPAVPWLALGLGLAWNRLVTRSARRGVIAVAFVLLALGSAALVWTHFFAWRGY